MSIEFKIDRKKGKAREKISPTIFIDLSYRVGDYQIDRKEFTCTSRDGYVLYGEAGDITLGTMVGIALIGYLEVDRVSETGEYYFRIRDYKHNEPEASHRLITQMIAEKARLAELSRRIPETYTTKWDTVCQ